MARKPARATAPAAPAVNRELLAQIVSATAANSFVYTSPEQHNPLINHQGGALVVINPGMVNPSNNVEIATAATEIGKAFMNTPEPAPQSQPAQSTGTPGAVISSFQIIKNASLPPIVRRSSGAGATIYPFETMEVGDAFFVPATAERENPAKSLASTVSSANLRYATEKQNPDGTPIMRKTRKGKEVPAVDFVRQYVARSVKNGQKYGEFTAPADGALVQRLK